MGNYNYNDLWYCKSISIRLKKNICGEALHDYAGSFWKQGLNCKVQQQEQDLNSRTNLK
jgi:hypothetical protein